MESVVVWYLRMSLFYFLTGSAIGFSMLIWPSEAGYYIPVHVHLNLLGFMSMMIYGVGYHILPKFSGKLIYSSRIMHQQFWFANAGLIGMASSWPFVTGDAPVFGNILIISSALTIIAIILFAFNLLKTLKSA